MNGTEGSIIVAREELPRLVLGTIFVFLWVAAWSAAALRRRTRLLIMVWFGLFVGLFGVRILLETNTLSDVLPGLQSLAPRLSLALRFSLVVPALLFWLELCVGKLRSLLRGGIVAGVTIAIAAIVMTWTTGSAGVFLIANRLLVVASLTLLTTVSLVPALSRRYLVVQSRVLGVGMLVAAATVAYVNLTMNKVSSSYVHRFFEPPAFAIFVASLGYVAAEYVFSNERRLASVQNELEIAREIQASILPLAVPSVAGLAIAVGYEPMAAVGGDFYDFVEPDDRHVGVLVADVTGHGVPAAIIASMLRVAIHSVAEYKREPGRLLHELNAILTPQLRSQLITVGYVWIDTEKGIAAYSSAGHPPLLHWHSGQLNQVESNGMLMGVSADVDYPTRQIALAPGDRLVLCTDGVLEPENARREQFGTQRLEQVLRTHHAGSAEKVSHQLLAELDAWQAHAREPQDDVTLVVIDVGPAHGEESRMAIPAELHDTRHA